MIHNERRGNPVNKEIKLPSPKVKGTISVEETISKRRSRREYKDEPLSLKEVGQLLWAASGITAKWGGRAAPSAGATYPIETYLLVGRVEKLDSGLYHYLPSSHSLIKVMEGSRPVDGMGGDLRRQLASAALGQGMIREAPITIVLAAVFQRTTGRYGKRGIRYVNMEIGHIGENIYLQAEAMDLATVAVGAFNDAAVKKLLRLKEEVLYLMPVGRQ
ncbi:MAG: SagB/ThcOx family dehydrogenase [Candidatus Omnitrophica bacterium]|nr:SagB/ThcOx family dehydrogenase [Candidatus Omnitrophota bacterium]